MDETNGRPPRRAGRLPALVLLACAAAVAGVVFRVDGLGRKSLWVDEVSTHRRVAQPWAAMLEGLAESPFPPLYYMALWGWVRIWGLGDATLRSLPACLGVAAIPITYGVWRPLVGRRASLWLLALVSLNACHIEYSRDAKMYGAVWLLSCVSGGTFLRALSERSRRVGWLAAYAASTACLLLVSYVGVVPLAVQAIYAAGLAWRRPELRRAVLGVGLAALIAVLPSGLWMSSALKAATHRTGIDWIPPASPARAPGDLYRLFGAFLLGYRVPPASAVRVTDAWGEVLETLYAPCLLIVAALVASTLRVGGGRPGGERPEGSDRSQGPGLRAAEVTAFLALWLLLPLVGALVYSIGVYSVWGVPRYLLGAAPALVVWLAVALGRLRSGRLALVLGGLVLASNLTAVTFDRTHCTRTPWREMARAIEHVSAATARDPGPGEGPTVGVVIVSQIRGFSFERNCLEYALGDRDRRDVDSRPAFVPLGDAFRRRVPFVVVAEVFLRSHHPATFRRRLVERATAEGYECRRISSALVYQEPFTAMPTPTAAYSAEVWLCTPPLAPQRASGDPDRASSDVATSSKQG